MEAKFYLSHVDEFRKNGIERVLGVLHFSLTRETRGGAINGPDTIIALKAELDHILRYEDAYRKFQEENPEYVLPWKELAEKFQPAKAKVVTSPAVAVKNPPEKKK